jgi:hypothetical protein
MENLDFFFEISSKYTLNNYKQTNFIFYVDFDSKRKSRKFRVLPPCTKEKNKNIFLNTLKLAISP